ncbi:EAL and HDOD domain-containing protein [Euzebya sp.]|uniref:EAL and HDOD domain-containing protein n=1 Tax=Euzebya sp. TaxID=1971409 RepID=UPI0035114234
MRITHSTLELGTGAISTVQVSRQPILRADVSQALHGYELSFSDAEEVFGVFAEVDDQRATAEVLDHTVLTLGVERVVGDALVFVRFPRQQVLDGTPSILPAGRSVIELGPDCWADGDTGAVTAACRRYAEKGYRIALVDFHHECAAGDLVRLADYIAVDVSRRTDAQLADTMAVLERHGARIIATDVDDEHHRERVTRAGVDYVQGFYFSTPDIVSGRELPGFKLAYLQLLRAAYSEDVDFEELAEIIKRDVALSYKLLRFVNSAHFGLRGEVTSVLHALTMLGLVQVRSWVGVATVSGMVHPRTQELAVLAATRARFCESLARRLRVASSHEAFALGMFSLLDALLGKSMEEALESVTLPASVVGALLGEPGELVDLLRVVVAYERGRWDVVSELAAAHGWQESELIGMYVDAIEWSRDFFGTTAG